ncbi:MAG TPA: type III-A CRISPR-associated RAMP protein Csm4 [Thermoflexia bacterium]|nr:type III-A CRISPR-associated RAMP protein Csm4 [Thermoflexia bacterium]
MPNLTEYCLVFRSGFHLGTRGVDVEESAVHIPSDTLFAALVDAHRLAGGDPDAFLAPFPRPQGEESTNDGPPFLLTSAFPFAGAIRFFPMPVSLDRWFEEETLRTRHKDLKRIRFVSEGLFRRMLAGEKMDGWLFPSEGEDPEKGIALQSGALWLSCEEVDGLPETMWLRPDTKQALPLRALRYARVWARQQVPRVTVDRVSSASEIFHAGRVVFSPECGLWFGVEWRAPDREVEGEGIVYQDALHRALALLADDGLGGERSAGYGVFTWRKGETLSLPDPSPGELLYLLSRYHPRKEELPAALTGGDTAYSLVSVGGWLRSPDGAAQRRRRLWLVAEGSIVQTTEGDTRGDVVDVRPTYENPAGDLPHPVWRYGLALGAGLKEVDRG